MHALEKFGQPVFAALALLFCLLCSPALAHKGSDAYLDVQDVQGVQEPQTQPFAPGQRQLVFVLSVAIKDMDQLLPLDANADGKVTWGEVKAAWPAVLAVANETAQLDVPASTISSSTCQLAWQADGLEQRGDGAYLRLKAQPQCPQNQALALRYTLFAAQDANHRLLVAGRIGGNDLLTTTSPLQQASLPLSAGVMGTESARAAPPSGRWAALSDYFWLGVHHLLQGYDHLAFLLALVLPLRLSLRAGQAQATAAGQGGRNVWLVLLGTITAFTVGHSITLVLATLGVTSASPAWVEPVIALSIGVTALLNLRPVAWIRTDVLALLFGMVHGYGFAGLLLEAQAPGGLLPWALAGFNLGVEAGQLSAVIAWVLLSQPVINRPWYGAVVVRGGSVLLMGLAAWWFFQRVL